MRRRASVIVVWLICSTVVIQAASLQPAVQIECRFVLFDAEDVDAIMRQEGMLHADDLIDLQREGKGLMLYSPLTITTVQGKEGNAKAVLERSYPTTFEHERSQVVEQSVCSSQSVGVADVGGFDTVQWGVFLTARASLLANREYVHLELFCKADRELEADKYVWGHAYTDAEEPGVPLEQPASRRLSIYTAVIVQDGETVAIGSQSYGPNGETLFLMVTARVVNT